MRQSTFEVRAVILFDPTLVHNQENPCFRTGVLFLSLWDCTNPEIGPTYSDRHSTLTHPHRIEQSRLAPDALQDIYEPLRFSCKCPPPPKRHIDDFKIFPDFSSLGPQTTFFARISLKGYSFNFSSTKPSRLASRSKTRLLKPPSAWDTYKGSN